MSRVQCIGKSIFDKDEVSNCQGNQAKTGTYPIYPYRIGERMSVKVFRKFCLQCMGGNREAVSDCETETCPAYQYRFGKNPVLVGKRGKGNTDALRIYRENARDSANNQLETTFLENWYDPIGLI